MFPSNGEQRKGVRCQGEMWARETSEALTPPQVLLGQVQPGQEMQSSPLVSQKESSTHKGQQRDSSSHCVFVRKSKMSFIQTASGTIQTTTGTPKNHWIPLG